VQIYVYMCRSVFICAALCTCMCRSVFICAALCTCMCIEVYKYVDIMMWKCVYLFAAIMITVCVYNELYIDMQTDRNSEVMENLEMEFKKF
jgi:formate/nitrite transporter FocA (FNT family)